ncbi:MAG: phospholipase D-like domain-containing protein [Thermoanaerobaculaceae bacterium]|jgi:cardiolipin synthase|nr:phospholipase D-like domain-containing protein [Thermoanaerobaculaceae bacterium]
MCVRVARSLRAVAGLAAVLATGCATVRRYEYYPPLTSSGADIQAALAIAAGNDAVDGNRVDILENGDQVFPAMLDAIRQAKSSIHLEPYILTDSAVGREFIDSVLERARAGVKVRLLLDSFGTPGIGTLNEKLLRDAGAQVVFFHPTNVFNLRKIFLRTHRKILVVDGKLGFTGGICIDDEWTGDGTDSAHWRDTMVRVQGPVVRQMQAAFARAWLEATGEVLAAHVLFPRLPAANGQRCQLMESTPGFDGNPARISFLVAVNSAHSTIDITNAYFAPDSVALSTLERAAKRGVRVRLLLPSRLTDARPVRYAGRSDYTRLLRAGIEVYEYQAAKLHAKTMVVDGTWASVGSTNLTSRSLYFNYEANLNVFDERFAASMCEMFERDLTRAQRVTLEAWKARPFKEKLAESFWGLFRKQY